MSNPIEIPIATDTPLYTERVTIDGAEFILRFDWQGRENRWRFDLGDTEGNWILTGVKIVCNVDLLRKCAHANRPPGTLLAVDYSNQNGEPPAFQDLVRRVRLMYYPKDAPAVVTVTQPFGA